MDIHKPKPAHSWREFFSEIAIVVCGVLIALTGEQLVEFARGHERVHEGEAQMRKELTEDDGPQFYLRLAQSPCISAQLDSLVADLLSERDNGLPFHKRTLQTPTFFTWDNDAYRQAMASSTMAHMSPQRGYDWSGPYTMIDDMKALNLRESVDYAELEATATAPQHLPEALRDRLLSAALRARSENLVMTRLAGKFVGYAKDAEVILTLAQKHHNLDFEPDKFAGCRAIREA